MDILQWKMDVEAHIVTLRQELAQLGQCVCQNAGQFAFHQREGEPHTSGKVARQQAMVQLMRLEYPLERGSVPRQYAALMASDETLVQVEKVNVAKAAFEALHGHIRAEIKLAGSDAWASELMRRVLTLAGEPGLSLDACDRLIPVLHQPVQRIRWYHLKTAANNRKTLTDAIAALEALRDKVPEDRIAFIEEELGKLKTLPPDTPVAYRPRAAVESIRFRARVLDDQADKGYAIHQDYGVNPIFFPDSAALPPDIGTPQQRRKAGAGRPTTISEEAVSFSLPHWFWYKGAEEKAPRKPKPPKQNPYAKTPYPGLWLGTRKRKNGITTFVMVAVPDKATQKLTTTSVSIGRHGLAGAWEKAATLYSQHHNLPLQDVLENQPTQEQVDNMLAWQGGSRRPAINCRSD